MKPFLRLQLNRIGMGEINMHLKNFINGKWKEGRSGEINEVKNPANINECVATTVSSTVDDVDEAVTYAKSASELWKKLSPVERGKYLHEVANQFEEHVDEIAKLATKEMGKRLEETRGEVLRGVAILRYYAQEGMRKIGEMLPSAASNNHLYAIRVPVGVIGVISPWNFPIAIPIWKIAPALIYGNTVVWKPAKHATASAVKIAEMFSKANVPAGVLNLVNGTGSVVGNRIVEHPDVHAITFTGSNQVGQTIATKVVSQNKKYQLELGGKNPAIVLEDADINMAAKLTIEGAMKQTGQRCTATSRVFVEKSIYQPFLEKLLGYVKNIQVGNGMDSDVTMGPVVSKSQYDSILHYIEIGKKEGAEIIYGGNALNGKNYDQGYYIEPTIFTNVTNDMVIAQEEIFGPVLSVIQVENYEEALAQANDTIYGLSASLFTSNLEKTFHFIQNSEVGMVQVNGETGGAEPQAPFGGMKQSSSGSREQGQAAVEFFTEYKTVAITSTFS